MEVEHLDLLVEDLRRYNYYQKIKKKNPLIFFFSRTVPLLPCVVFIFIFIVYLVYRGRKKKVILQSLK